MSLSRTFREAQARWIESEEALSARTPRSTTLAQAAIGSGQSSAISDALAVSPPAFAPVQDIRSNITEIISQPEGMNALFSLALEEIRRSLEDTLGISDDIMESITVMSTAFSNVPPFVSPEARQAALDRLEAVASRIEIAVRSSESSGDAQSRTDQAINIITSLVDEGVLDRDQVGEFVRQNDVNAQAFRSSLIQRVDRLEDRFWRVVTVSADPDPAPISVLPASLAGVMIVDENNQPVAQISGARGVYLGPDGVLLVQGGDGFLPSQIRTLRIVPTEDSVSPTSRIPISVQLQQGTSELDTAREELEEALKFDVWACLVLDLGERLDNLLQRLNQKINSVYFKVRSALLRIVTGDFLGALPTVQINWKAGLAELTKSLGVNFGLEVPSALLGVTDRLSFISLDGGGSVLCDLEQKNHCRIHTSLLNLREELDRLTQLAQIRLSGDTALDLAQKLGWNPAAVRLQMEQALQPIDQFVARLEESRLKLRGELCSWVRNRQAGVPPSVSQAQVNILGFAAIIPAIILAFLPATLGVPFDPSLINSLNKLKGMGLDRFADDLSNLDLAQVLGVPQSASTRAGQAADVLELASNQTGSLARARQLTALSDVTRDRHEQTMAHETMRMKILARHHGPTSAMVAKEVGDQGLVLCGEVDREAD